MANRTTGWGTNSGKGGFTKGSTPARLTPVQKDAKQSAGGAKAVAPSIAQRDAGQAAAGGKALTPTAKPPPGGVTKPSPAPTSTPTNPFLNPAQQAAWNTAALKYGLNVTKVNNALTQAGASLKLNQGTLAHGNAVAHDNTNQSLAARGLFQSSIRAGDLNDLDATFAMRNNILTTNYANAVINGQNQLGTLGTDWTTTQNYYNQLAVQNAQAIQPVPTPAPTAPKPTTPPNKPAPNSPASHPAVTDAGQSQGGNNALNPAGVDAGQIANANNALNGQVTVPAPGGTGWGSTTPGGGW